jgi:hypothetical protein
MVTGAKDGGTQTLHLGRVTKALPEMIRGIKDMGT